MRMIEEVGEMLTMCHKDKHILWMEEYNQWVLLEEPAWYVIKMINKGIDTFSISKACEKKYGTSQIESNQFVNDILVFLENIQTAEINPIESQTDKLDQLTDLPVFKSSYQYTVNKQVFMLSFEEEWMEKLVHPLFEHLLSNKTAHEQVCFYLYKKEGRYAVTLATDELKTWTFDNTGLWKGKLVSELLNFIYKKQENDWMTLVHGSAITDGKKSVIITATNGGGKSTLTALMQTKGYHFVSDDVVAIDGQTGLVYPFPAALSVKDGSVGMLAPFFPELPDAKQYSFSGSGKNVRYLAFSTESEPADLTKEAAAIIFVNYSSDIDFQLERLDSFESLQRFNQEAWIIPTRENAERYLKWITKIPAYELKYSNTEKAMNAVEALF